MLLSLRIENYALINKVSIEFPCGFTAITGETGAGKSILLGALSLLAGARADTGVLFDKDRKCIVEAEFALSEDFATLFEESGLDADNNGIFRREIAPNGKSRAFINDTPVQLATMKALGERLMDIHSQHTTLTLKGSAFQRLMVDGFLDNRAIAADFKAGFSKWKSEQTAIGELETKYRNFQKEQDYYAFLLEEFANADLRHGEQESLEAELEMMTHSEEIKLQISQSLALIDNEDYASVLFNLSQVRNNLSKISSYSPALKDIADRINSAYIELKDVHRELEICNDEVAFDPDRLAFAKDRLSVIYRLQSKHSVNSVEELLEIRERIAGSLSSNEHLREEIDQRTKANAELFNHISEKALEISRLRIEAAKTIEEQVKPLLCDMGMANAEVKIVIEPDRTLKNMNESGIDDIDFLFSANKGSEPKPLSKVASGGELSRLMLALKAVSSSKNNMPTIIFDEIDSGVSGDIAAKVGNIIKRMAANHQLLVITHLPQMAAKASCHYKVFKEDVDAKTVSNIKKLDADERIEEIAKMLSNDSVTQAAVNNAKALLN
ncbi:MAG: DNA repair protein RecN [Bacteroidales bacterium]|jgi:DNA repair protein RecN (Recombination protein N)|nr:DNA repair protein RecN [Bacteroidales bacterium]